MKMDYRSAPVRKLVTLGESNGFGMCAGDPRNEWVQALANLIRDFQDEPLSVRNNSIPGCVISPRSPGYPGLPEGSLPSALERFEDELIAPGPDIAVVAFGLNDSRCGNPVGQFVEDMNDDQCHFNDVGHRVIGQAVFNTIAASCSFVGRKSIRQAREAGLDVTNTGGTSSTSRMVHHWLHR